MSEQIGSLRKGQFKMDKRAIQKEMAFDEYVYLVVNLMIAYKKLSYAAP